MSDTLIHLATSVAGVVSVHIAVVALEHVYFNLCVGTTWRGMMQAFVSMDSTTCKAMREAIQVSHNTSTSFFLSTVGALWFNALRRVTKPQPNTH
jgi:hypothetical protein